MDQKCSEKEAGKLWEPAEAAVKMQRLFKRAAKDLRREDYHLREDLVQEMSLAVLECEGSHPLTFYMCRAVCRAINFLEYWELGKERIEPLNPKDPRFSYDPEEREARRQAAIAELKRRGFEFLLKDIDKLDLEAIAAARQAA
jgi:hypothetical protein